MYFHSSRVPTPFEIKTKYQNTEEYVRPWHGIILSYIFLKRGVAFALGQQIGSTCSTQLKGDCILDLIYTQSSQTQPLFSTISPLCLPLLLCFAFCFWAYKKRFLKNIKKKKSKHSYLYSSNRWISHATKFKNIRNSESLPIFF